MKKKIFVLPCKNKGMILSNFLSPAPKPEMKKNKKNRKIDIPI